MRKHRGNWKVRWLAAVALATALGSEGGFDVAGGGASIGSEAWMPDVGPRIDELTERAKVAAAQATSRRSAARSGERTGEKGGGTLNGQWWRAVAARPALGVAR